MTDYFWIFLLEISNELMSRWAGLLHMRQPWDHTDPRVEKTEKAKTGPLQNGYCSLQGKRPGNCIIQWPLEELQLMLCTPLFLSQCVREWATTCRCWGRTSSTTTAWWGCTPTAPWCWRTWRSPTRRSTTTCPSCRWATVPQHQQTSVQIKWMIVNQ